MLPQPGQNVLLNLYRIAGIGLVAETAMDKSVVPFPEENAKHSLGRSFVVRPVECQRRSRQATITLLRALPQSTDRLNHESSVYEKEISHGMVSWQARYRFSAMEPAWSACPPWRAKTFGVGFIDWLGLIGVLIWIKEAWMLEARSSVLQIPLSRVKRK